MGASAVHIGGSLKKTGTSRSPRAVTNLRKAHRGWIDRWRQSLSAGESGELFSDLRDRSSCGSSEGAARSGPAAGMSAAGASSGGIRPCARARRSSFARTCATASSTGAAAASRHRRDPPPARYEGIARPSRCPRPDRFRGHQSPSGRATTDSRKLKAAGWRCPHDVANGNTGFCTQRHSVG
jgi:hypothetical protein